MATLDHCNETFPVPHLHIIVIKEYYYHCHYQSCGPAAEGKPHDNILFEFIAMNLPN